MPRTAASWFGMCSSTLMHVTKSNRASIVGPVTSSRSTRKCRLTSPPAQYVPPVHRGDPEAAVGEDAWPRGLPGPHVEHFRGVALREACEGERVLHGALVAPRTPLPTPLPHQERAQQESRPGAEHSANGSRNGPNPIRSASGARS